MIKPIMGTWFEFQHHNTAEGKYWNSTLDQFTSEDWDVKVREVAELGMEYVVLMHVAVHDKAYYPTDMYPHADIACYNPTEVVFNAADKYGLKIFLGNDFFFKWDDPNIVTDPDARRRRLRAIGELYAQFGHHKSFYGWYWPNEAYIGGHYNERFMEYVNECSKEARRFTPHGKILIAPYGTRDAIPDDKYVKQLESMDVDIVAYQDEIGVQKSTVDETAKFYEGLRKAHDKVPHVKLWADVEIFDFEGQVYRSALIPADFDRIIKQFANVTPYVDNILVYQYQGMMSKPGQKAYAGHENAGKLYTDYYNWLKENHPEMLRKL